MWHVCSNERIMKPEETLIAREHHGNNTWIGVFYAVCATFSRQQIFTQQYRNCLRRCFICRPCRGNIRSQTNWQIGISGRDPRGTWHQEELADGKPPVLN
jgi:hypothetical protein